MLGTAGFAGLGSGGCSTVSHGAEAQRERMGNQPDVGGFCRNGKTATHPRSRHREELDDQNHRTARSEEHTSELQSPYDLVCRLLLEKKKYKGTVEDCAVE